ncbi:hypothetical protein HELRODRAFT_84734 [Helobdella robusta]|uniref:FHOD1/3-like FH3 domain-containing protein n=1 Tax=Helobdella robusta TaxID=6412 RepID=T1G5M8_HELRO|nr:hypothetical protein HELRODRAFT_84734 [Helobdella robusta]ESN98260.1 hypothetical protein HELRODRAFT_84734 [Helobdella robusta]
MLNVDGMNGIVSVNSVVQWLYALTGSTSAAIVKTSVRLLLMFVCYSECNSFLFIQAVSASSISKGCKKMYSNLMDLLKQSNRDNSQWNDACLFAMLLINKMLEPIPDQDTFYNAVDVLLEQGIDKVRSFVVLIG